MISARLYYLKFDGRLGHGHSETVVDIHVTREIFFCLLLSTAWSSEHVQTTENQTARSYCFEFKFPVNLRDKNTKQTRKWGEKV